MNPIFRRVTLMGCIAATFVVLAAVPGHAAQTVTATTLPASNVTATSSVLNGSVNTGGAAVAWEFQWGLSTAYNNHTPVQTIAAGHNTPVAVSATLTGLNSNTTYHFRLVVLYGNGTTYSPFQVAYGTDRSFTTKSVGTLKLKSKKLHVVKGRVRVKLACASKLDCNGSFKINTSTKLKKGKKKSIVCATKSYTIKAGKTSVVKAKVRHGCLAVLKKKKSIKAKFTSTPASGQSGVSKKVKLVLG